MRILDMIMWFNFFISFIISVFTILVLFGVMYIKPFIAFSTLLPLEISLIVTIFIWGIDSLYNEYTRDSRYTFFYSLILSGILLVFIVLGVY